jgi:hypothetical protein
MLLCIVFFLHSLIVVDLEQFSFIKARYEKPKKKQTLKLNT